MDCETLSYVHPKISPLPQCCIAICKKSVTNRTLWQRQKRKIRHRENQQVVRLPEKDDSQRAQRAPLARTVDLEAHCILCATAQLCLQCFGQSRNRDGLTAAESVGDRAHLTRASAKRPGTRNSDLGDARASGSLPDSGRSLLHCECSGGAAFSLSSSK